MGYNIAAPIPAVTNLGPAIQDLYHLGGRGVFQTTGGTKHIFTAFSGYNAVASFYLHWVQLAGDYTQADHQLFTGTNNGYCNMFAYIPALNKLCLGNYTGLETFDPVAKTLTVGTGCSGWHPMNDICTGSDNKVYCYCGGYVLSYDPNADATLDYTPGGKLHASASSDYGSIIEVNGYVFACVNIGTDSWVMFSTATGAGFSWAEYDFSGGGDDGVSTAMGTGIEQDTNKPYMYRTLTGGTKKYYYINDDGTLTYAGSFLQGLYLGANKRHCWNDDSNRVINNYNVELDCFGSNFTALWPSIYNSDSVLGWRYNNGAGSTGDWQYSTLTFAGSFIDMAIYNMEQKDESTYYCFPNDYATTTSFNYITSTIYGLGGSGAIYGTVTMPNGDICFGAYPNVFVYWTAPYTGWGGASSKTISSGLTGQYHYHFMFDYDASGLVWSLCNTIRYRSDTAASDCGNLMWFDPSDDSYGFVFDGAGGNPDWTVDPGGVEARSMCMALSRSKILVSGKDDNLYVVDAATKTPAASPYAFGSGIYAAAMVEVSDDVVVGITSDNKVFKFTPSTQTMAIEPQATGVGGTALPWVANATARMFNRLVVGIDGYVWLSVDADLYRINPSDLSFTLVKALDHSYGLKFSDDHLNLFLFNANGNGVATDLQVIKNIFIGESGYLSPSTWKFLSWNGSRQFNGQQASGRINGQNL